MKDKEKQQRMDTFNANAALAFVVLVVAILRGFLYLPHDPDQCGALLSSGRYLDGADKWTWQPQGCMAKDYSIHPNEKSLATISDCLLGRQLVFVGDSTVREVFFGMARVLEPTLVENSQDDEFKHSDRTVVARGIRLTFIWDPFLNSTKTQDILASSTLTDSVPTLAVFGTGLWYLRHSSSFTNGGISAFKEHTNSIFHQLSSSSQPLADQIVFMPVLHVWEDMLSPARRETINNADINLLNAHLEELDDALPGTPGIAKAFNLIIADEGRREETEDGMHYPYPKSSVSQLQANILYNLRCNEFLPVRIPFEPTCCREYPRANWVQAILIAALVGTAGYGLLTYLSSFTNSNRKLSDSQNAIWIAGGTFASAMIYCYATDRTHLFLKESKSFSPYIVGFWFLVSLIAGLYWRNESGKDLGFLNRDQTDEWKGWMQIVILIYHWYGASGTLGIYNPVRVLVAAYLFMTGYGHAFFYYKKNNFAFKRVLSVLVRLNLLAVAMVYVLDTDYLSLYFSPLVSMHYLFIYLTMRVGSSLNKSLPFFLFKVFALCLILAFFFAQSLAPIELLFSIFSTVFDTQWIAREWQFRTALDLYAPYAGMIVAFATIKVDEYKLKERESWGQIKRFTVGGSGLAMIWYFYFELTRTSKQDYNSYHPYISFIPVIAFVFLRNATPYLRGTSSVLFAYFGKISLETFMLQFNIWLAADTKGILFILPFIPQSWRGVNFIISSIVFVWTSERVGKATGVLTEFLCEEWKPVPKDTIEVLPTTSSVLDEKLDIREESLKVHHKVWDAIKTDLRARTVAALIVLTILNHLWPHRILEAHILPTH